jgi:ADP-ribose pyrophosphatase YjhB (NUDIX family)
MKQKRMPKNVAEFLEELRSIARLGLNYSKDSYDRKRYERLLQLSAMQYSKLAGLPENVIIERFRNDLGHITPKVGVDAAIFNQQGQLLFMKRSDDGLWCLPCGWADLGETPQEGVRREVWEETGLRVRVKSLIDVFTRLPGAFGQPHTAYFLLFHCTPGGGRLSTSAEAVEVGYFNHKSISRWHGDHKEKAQRAHQYWLETQLEKKKTD